MRIYWNYGRIRVALQIDSNLPVIDSHGEDLFSDSYNKKYKQGEQFVRTAITSDGDWILRACESGGEEIFVSKHYVDVGLFKSMKFPELKTEAKWRIADETEENDD